MPICPDRARASLLGLALGDAYGRSLEFVTGPRVRTRPVPIPSRDFMWTDDTHMALYLVEALASLGPAGLRAPSEDDLGRAVGAAFVRWADDPLTPSTAPGNTCLTGAARFRQTGDWRRSGVKRSDGCGAVMRIAPLPVLWSGAPLVMAARVQSAVTHGHDNAIAAAIAGCLLTRALLEGAPLAPETVQATVRRLRALGQTGEDEVVIHALEAAIDQAGRPALPHLDEAHIPAGDGGWRSPSALGLAVVAALRWGDDFALAVEKAARINGDSDSVACLAGMLIGATHGTAALPPPWLSALPQRVRIDDAIETLLALAPGLAPAPAPPPPAARTSATDPIRVAWAAEVGSRGGRLGLTFAPGKQVSSLQGPPWHRDLEADLQLLAEGHQVDVLVSLVEEQELALMRIPQLVAAAEARGIAVLRHAVPDGGVPQLAACRHSVQAAVSLARAGHRVVFHCRGGLGRAGTFAACALRLLGLEPAAAMATVRRVRPGAIENTRQEAFVQAF